MTEKELIEKVAEDALISKRAASNAIESVFEAIKTALCNGETFTRKGFGTFSTIMRSAREGRNPKTGEKLDIPARRVAKFKASSVLGKLIAAPAEKAD